MSVKVPGNRRCKRYKSNEPTLNILLPLLNERIFFNDGKAIKVPLVSLFAASNEEPEDDGLKAMHDRLLFRTVVNYVKDPSNRMKMHQNFVNESSGSSVSGQKTTVTLEELHAARLMASKLPVTTNLYKVFAKLLGILEKTGIVVSDRRQNECYKIMQGNALLNGRTQVVLDDLSALKAVLWEQAKDMGLIESEIDKLVNPFDDEINGLWKKANEVLNNLAKITDSAEKCGAAVEARQRLEDIIKKMNNVVKDATSNGKDVSEYTKKKDFIMNENNKILEETIGLNLNDMGLGDATRPSGFPF